MDLNAEEQLDLVKRLKSIADIGLVYAESDYSEERYQEVRQISLQLMAQISGTELKTLDNFFLPEKDYPTVKVDVRGFVLNEQNEILMAKERLDNKWTIPGGWADVGDTPSEAVLKEIKEETGYEAEVCRLLAIYDKRCHPHPPQPFYIYKLIFLCNITGGVQKHGYDMEAVGFFKINELPELSKDRILSSQLQQLYELAKQEGSKVHID